MTNETKPIDLPSLRSTMPAELFELPRIRTFAKAVFLVALLGGAIAWGTTLDSILLKTLLGIALGPFLFALASVGHESGHNTASRWRFLNDLTGLVSMSVIGIPARGWKVKHDIHHQFGGVPDRDTDLEFRVDRYLSHGRLMRWAMRTFNRWEFLFWWAAPLSLWITSWIYAVRNLRRQNAHHKRRTHWTIADMALSATFFAAMALYTYLFGWLNLAMLIAVPFAVSGVVAAICFVPNHRGMPPLNSEQARRPARFAHVNSRTVLYPRFLPANYFMNYVPWQIEHHIFPTVAGYRLKRLSAYLRSWADRAGVTLTYEPVHQVLPRMLRRDWLWGNGDGLLYTYADADTIARKQTTPR